MSAEAERRTESVPEWKREEVETLRGIVAGYESVGIVEVAGIPARQLQEMRRELHGSAQLRIARNTLIRRALEAAGLDALSPFVSGQVGIIGTDDNPFGLFKQLEASKTPAPINAGEPAPDDIVIPAGDTGIDPGPFVGELQQVGADARIQDGSIHVLSDSTVLEAGGTVSAELANVLSELGIEPKEVGLDLRGVRSEGVLFEPDELAIDVDEYRADVEAAAARGRSLSVEAAYPTPRTTGTLLAAADGGARALGLAAGVASPDLAEDLLARADGRLRALAAAIGDDEALPPELRDVDAPPGGGTGADHDADADPDADEPTDDHEPEPDAGAPDADDDEDGDDGGAALGDMFG